MNKTEFKTAILREGKAKHQSVIDDYRNRIKELQSSEMMINDGQFDYQQQGYNEEVNTRISSLAEELNFAVDEMSLLDTIRIEEPLHSEVGFGSVVVTDKIDFFVSVSIENFEVDGRNLFGISTKSPIYGSMNGKKQGDTFSFKEHKYTIKDIF